MIEKKKQNYIKSALDEFISQIKQIGLNLPEGLILLRLRVADKPMSIRELAYESDKSYASTRNALSKFFKLGLVSRKREKRKQVGNWISKVYVYRLFGG